MHLRKKIAAQKHENEEIREEIRYRKLKRTARRLRAQARRIRA